MSKLNYEITLYHSPYHDALLEELSSIIRQKKNIYRNLHSEKDIENHLSFEEREILKHLIAREDKILLELIEHKGWLRSVDNIDERRHNFTDSFLDDNFEHRAHFMGY